MTCRMLPQRSMAKLNITRSGLMDQTCFRRSGGLGPISLPLFRGVRLGMVRRLNALSGMALLLGYRANEPAPAAAMLKRHRLSEPCGHSRGTSSAAAVARDPGCVKTHTSAKCGKYNSRTPYKAVGAQHDLTLRMRTSSEMFYARSGRSSSHTAKTRSRLRPILNLPSQSLT